MEATSLLNRQSIRLGDTLGNLIQTFPFPAHIKDAQTRRYLTVNKKYANFCGVNHPNQLIGLTLENQPPRGGPDNSKEELKKVSAQEALTLHSQKLTNDYRKFCIRHDGLLCVDNTVKWPLFGQHKRIVAILTIGYDISHSLGYLFSLYLEYYPLKKAIYYFLKHSKLDQFFLTSPSYKELMVLLRMQADNRPSSVANQLYVKKDTIYSHIKNLRNKLVTGIDLNQCLIHLREQKNRGSFGE